MKFFNTLTVEKAVSYGPTRSNGHISALTVRLTLLAGILEKGHNVHLMEETFTGFSELSIRTKSTAAYRQSRRVTVQLSVISGLHIASVVLVEVGQAVVHEDVALYERKDGIADRIRNQ